MPEENKPLPKLVAIVGPTACGKTACGIRLAKKFGGEIISADSRQIYKKMDIGTAKALGEWKRVGLRRFYHIEEIPHHLIDFLDPGKIFSAAEFHDQASRYAKTIMGNSKLPIVVGGTGLYISALIDNLIIPRVEPNKKLRVSLEQKSCEELMNLLRQMDPDAAKNIDAKNKRRIIRALEVCIFTGEPFSSQKKKGETMFDTLQIGLRAPKEVLHKRIGDRVDRMMKLGLLKEIEGLLKQKYAWQLPSMSGIGYRQFKDYFDNKISLDEAIEFLKRDTRRYASRQMTWFKRDKRIKWVEDNEEAERLVEEFVNH